mgnify:CR=1 FL=1
MFKTKQTYLLTLYTLMLVASLAINYAIFSLFTWLIN